MLKSLRLLCLFSLLPLLVAFRTNMAFHKYQQDKLVFTSVAQSVYNGACSGMVTVQSQTASGVPKAVVSNTSVNLSSTGTMIFFSDSGCTASISAATIYSSNVSGTFYFMFSALGNETITAAATGYTSTSQIETSTTNPYIWIGGGGNVNWNTGANWSGGSAPGAGNQAIFDSTCVTNCSPTINTSISVASIRMKTGYTGTITQGAGNTITIGTNGWAQAAGTFIGGNSNIAIAGPSALVGGTFTSTSGVLNINGYDFKVAGATFNHNSGTFAYNGNSATAFLSLSGVTLNNFTKLDTNWSFLDLGSVAFTVNGTLTLGTSLSCSNQCNINNGTINAKGNVILQGDGNVGNAVIKLTGAGNQNIDATGVTAGGHFPSLEIASTGGTVSLLGTIGVAKNFTYTSGSVSAGTSTLLFNGTDQSISPGSPTYYNVTFDNSGWGAKDLLAGTMNVSNNLLLTSYVGCGNWCNITNGSFNVAGNFTSTNGGFTGSALVTMSGANSATYTLGASSNLPTGSVTINKSASATVTLASSMPLTYAGQALTISSGTLDLSGNALNVNSSLTIASAGSLICNGGTYSAGSLANSGLVDCASYPFNWTGAGGNSNWNTAANWSGGVAPNSTQVPTFNSTYCGATCNATVNVDPNVRGVRTTSGYFGTITQNAGVAMTIGSSGWIQNGGTFSGAASSITINGSFALNAGGFTSTSGTLSIQNNFTQAGTSTFTNNNGTVTTTNTSVITTASMSFKNLFLNSSYTTVTINGTVTVDGTLTYGSGCCGTSMIAGTAPATILARGDITVSPASGYGGGGNVLVKIAGSGNQTLNNVTAGALPNIEIASTGGTVTLVGTTSTFNFTHTSGTVAAGTSTIRIAGTVTTNGMSFNNLSFLPYGPIVNGTISVLGNLILDGGSGASLYLNVGTAPGIVDVKGNVTCNNYDNYGGGNAKILMSGSTNQTVTGTIGFFPNFEIASTGGVVTLAGTIKFAKNFTLTSGTISAAGSTVKFASDVSAATISPGSATYANVSFESSSTYTLANNLNVSGNINFDNTNNSSRSLNGSTINASGNVSATGYGYPGTTTINMIGATNSTLSVPASALLPSGGLTVNKSPGSTVTLASNTSLSTAGQDLTITSGTLNMAGYNLTIARNITNSDTLKRGTNPTCGTLTYGGSYTGTAAICP